MIPKHTFYVYPPVNGNLVDLPEGEAKHARQVLRLRPGDGVCLVDGQGHRYISVLESVTKQAVRARVIETQALEAALPVRVTLGASLLKNANRYETMLEKVAELGADCVVPLMTDRTEKNRIRLDRAESILVGAMKQSGSAFRTRILEPEAFLHFTAAAPESALRLIAHEETDPGMSLAARLAERPADHIVVAIGPEGGFTDEEIAAAEEDGFLQVSLGRSRLRGETASIVALAGIAQLAPLAERH